MPNIPICANAKTRQLAIERTRERITHLQSGTESFRPWDTINNAVKAEQRAMDLLTRYKVLTPKQRGYVVEIPVNQ